MDTLGLYLFACMYTIMYVHMYVCMYVENADSANKVFSWKQHLFQMYWLCTTNDNQGIRVYKHEPVITSKGID